MNSSTDKHVLVTGATGRIGTSFCRAAGLLYSLHRVDLHVPIEGDARDMPPLMQLDLCDLAACQAACVGIDTVIHLAADPSPEADFYGSLLDNNIKATYNIFRAAKDQGCRRVIYASSGQAVAGYPRDVQAHPDSMVRPLNMYGVTKCFGEAVASYFAHAEGLSSIAVRIGAYDVTPHNLEEYRQDPNGHVLDAYVSSRDLNQLLIRCIEALNVQFAIVHGISDNRFKRLDLTTTRDLLGYTPQDDAFTIFADILSDLLSN